MSLPLLAAGRYQLIMFVNPSHMGLEGGREPLPAQA